VANLESKPPVISHSDRFNGRWKAMWNENRSFMGSEIPPIDNVDTMGAQRERVRESLVSLNA